MPTMPWSAGAAASRRAAAGARRPTPRLAAECTPPRRAALLLVAVLLVVSVGSTDAARLPALPGAAGRLWRGLDELLRWARGPPALPPALLPAAASRPGHRWDPYLPIPDSAAHLAAERAAAAAGALQRATGGPAPTRPPHTAPTWPWPKRSVPWTHRDRGELSPLLPKEIMWLLAEAEGAVSNASRAHTRLAHAATLARINSVAYCPTRSVQAWNCSRCAVDAGDFDTEATVYDVGWDLFAFAGYSHVLRAPVLAFRGTDSRSIYNWAENMRYWRSDLPLPVPGAAGSLVHTGFYVSWNDSALAPNITAAAARLVAAHPGRPLYVAGHSLGAALATVAAVDVQSRLAGAGLDACDVRLFTFGSPRVGNAAFAAFVRNATTTSVRVTHNRDIVPSVPPAWVGFHHVATEAWQVDVEGAGVVGLCDDSGEDPRCHDSLCYLGLCTSVSDHLEYLGAPMLRGSVPGC